MDLDDPATRRRSWRWLRTRIVGLLSAPPIVMYGPDKRPRVIPATRIGLALEPPEL